MRFARRRIFSREPAAVPSKQALPHHEGISSIEPHPTDLLPQPDSRESAAGYSSSERKDPPDTWTKAPQILQRLCPSDRAKGKNRQACDRQPDLRKADFWHRSKPVRPFRFAFEKNRAPPAML